MSEFDDFLADFYTQYEYAASYFGGADIDLTNAKIWWNVPDDHAAIGSLILAVEHCIDSLAYWYDRYTYNYPRYNLVKLFLLIDERFDALEVGGEYELTPEKICEAWAADNFAGRMITVAFIDRMRQLLWDEPYFVAWAAAPEQSEGP